MSGHNPHGRLGQPNSSWNHLQVPSYIPRQPQLAHMSNERPMVRSPLTWHTPTPPESLYSFMTANHKGALDLNPLLPAFVRAPFGSVDLTIPSAARNSSTPSPRSLHSPGLGPPNLSSPPDFSIIKSGSNRTSTNLSPTPGVIQSTASIKDKIHTTISNNGEITPGGLYIRDAKQINNDIVKITREPIGLPPMTEPVELVKEAIFHSMKNHSVPISPLRKSPVRPTSKITVSPKRNKTPPANNDIPPVINNHLIHPPSPALTTLTSSSIVPLLQTIQNHQENSIQSESPLNNLTSEDSIDSNASKKRRKRKPNKTIRMSNDDDDDNNCNLTKRSSSVEKLTPIIIDKNSIPLKLSIDISNTKQNLEKIKSFDNHNIIEKKLEKKIESINDSTIKDDNKLLTLLNKKVENYDEKITENIIENNLNNRIEDNNKIIINNQSLITNSINKNDTLGNCVTKEINTPSLVPTTTIIKNNNNNFPTIINCNDAIDATSPRQRIQHKNTDTDECETIDKIAAMIASTDTENNQTLPEETKTAKQSCLNQINLEKTLNGTNINNKIDIVVDDNNKKKSETVCINLNDAVTKNEKTNSFEEVENKLQEMFAGIEDDRPLNDKGEEIINQQIIGDSLDSEINKIDNLNDSKSASTSKCIKRSKSEDINCGPPTKKKKKPVKKGGSNQNGKSKGKNGKGSSGNNHNNKIHKFSTNNNHKEKSKTTKDETGISNDGGRNYKGPFVQIRIDGSLTVVNASKIEDDIIKPQNKMKIKKPLHNQTSSERNKLRGLHISTLSMKYDADTTDTSWMCVFCKMGPHKCGLGDLFGPYILTTTSDDFQLSQIDPTQDVFKSKRTKQDMIQKYVANLAAAAAAGVPSTSGTNISSPAQSPLKKKKKMFVPLNINQTQTIAQTQPLSTTTTTSSISTLSTSSTSTTSNEIIELFTGMTKAGENSYEVWVHEDCAVWSSGVYFIGVRIVGLEAAVWSSTRHKCTICTKYGAMLCCLQRGCSNEVHVPCARNNNWTLNNIDFKSRCEKHSILSTTTS